ncbi:ATPase [Galbibacter sp. PAP.153]|uniref:ATP-binding cassette domain-containing protein n=1 Tax=Galbibacter sp. PAP.153 TaxID=3104623 RepID=UPI003008C9B5
MKNYRPHIIKEGGVEFQIGEFRGGTVMYDFKKMLIYMEAKGKLLFGKKFRIYKKDYKTLYKLCVYYIRDEDSCRKLGIDFNKGLLLSGPVGCGKTTLMKLMRYLVPHRKPCDLIPCRNIVFGFNNIGYRIIEQYGDHRFYCFDDLGAEPTGRHFGVDCNVLGEILLSRHDLFFKYKVKTHVTTNLNAQELEERYGKRVRSRMRELFNLVAFDKGSGDKRK